MEFVTLVISKELLQTLVDSDAITTDQFKVKYVDQEGVNYSVHPEWLAQSKKSNKEYQKLKEIEFNIRHNGNNNTVNS